jgi:hypothetical protein
MERGLLWLPTLAVFIWLARLGYREYRQIEAARTWAAGGERWKYDIYAVIRYQDRQLAWGKPAVGKDPTDIQRVNLDRIDRVELVMDDKAIDLADIPTRGKSIAVKLYLNSPAETASIPFTSSSIAAEWVEFLSLPIPKP